MASIASKYGIADLAEDDTQDQAPTGIAAKYGLAPPPDAGVGDMLKETTKRTFGQGIKGAGRVVEDIAGPNAIASGLTGYGEQLVKDNPQQIGSLSDVTDRPGAFLTEAVSQHIPQLTMALGGRTIGAGLGGLVAGPPGAAVGGILGGLLPIGAQEYGEIRDTQDETGQQDIGKAVAGTLAATGLELVGGPEAKIIRGLTPLKGAKQVGKEILKGAVGEGVQEVAQTGVERYSGGAPVTGDQAMEDYALSGLMGAAGGGIASGGIAGVQTMLPEQQAATPPVAPSATTAPGAPATAIPATQTAGVTTPDLSAPSAQPPTLESQTQDVVQQTADLVRAVGGGPLSNAVATGIETGAVPVAAAPIQEQPNVPSPALGQRPLPGSVQLGGSGTGGVAQGGDTRGTGDGAPMDRADAILGGTGGIGGGMAQPPGSDRDVSTPAPVASAAGGGREGKLGPAQPDVKPTQEQTDGQGQAEGRRGEEVLTPAAGEQSPATPTPQSIIKEATRPGLSIKDAIDQATGAARGDQIQRDVQSGKGAGALKSADAFREGLDARDQERMSEIHQGGGYVIGTGNQNRIATAPVTDEDRKAMKAGTYQGWLTGPHDTIEDAYREWKGAQTQPTDTKSGKQAKSADLISSQTEPGQAYRITEDAKNNTFTVHDVDADAVQKSLLAAKLPMGNKQPDGSLRFNKLVREKVEAHLAGLGTAPAATDTAIAAEGKPAKPPLESPHEGEHEAFARRILAEVKRGETPPTTGLKKDGWTYSFSDDKKKITVQGPRDISRNAKTFSVSKLEKESPDVTTASPAEQTGQPAAGESQPAADTKGQAAATSPLSGVEVTVDGVWSDGRKVKATLPAQEALDDVDQRIEFAKSLMECLRT